MCGAFGPVGSMGILAPYAVYIIGLRVAFCGCDSLNKTTVFRSACRSVTGSMDSDEDNERE